MEDKIRLPIKWFSFFMALMLFQSSYRNLGTITALSTLALAIITAFGTGNVKFSSFRFPIESATLTCFYILTILVSIIHGGLPSYFDRYSAQIILCIVFLGFSQSLNSNEAKFLYWVFAFSALFYSILTIWSCVRLGTLRYYHGRIEILGTRLDPNFIGLPFVIASNLFLGKVISEKKKLIWICGYIVLAGAIVFTASRGNMLAFIVSNACAMIYSVSKRDISFGRKIIALLAIVIIGCLMINYFSQNLSLQWNRITSYEDGSDNGRLILWGNAINAWKTHPIFGLGLESMSRLTGKATHNTYLQLLSETGVVGLLLFCSFLYLMVKRTFFYNKYLFCASIGLLVHIAFLNSLDNRCVWVFLCWVALMPKREIRIGKNAV